MQHCDRNGEQYYITDLTHISTEKLVDMRTYSAHTKSSAF